MLFWYDNISVFRYLELTVITCPAISEIDMPEVTYIGESSLGDNPFYVKFYLIAGDLMFLTVFPITLLLSFTLSVLYDINKSQLILKRMSAESEASSLSLTSR